MKTFTQPQTTGYRQLTEAEATLMNEGKALEQQCLAYVSKLRGHGDTPIEGTRDQRWVSIGETQLQQGFMALMRGITKPTT